MPYNQLITLQLISLVVLRKVTAQIFLLFIIGEKKKPHSYISCFL